MDETFAPLPEQHWDAGFEGGRYIVVSRPWPFVRTFQRPPEFRKRFWHSVHELAIRDWHITLTPLDLGGLCKVETELHIRYQPGLRYAREHLEFLADLNTQLEGSLHALLKDIAEQEIRRMESDSAWLEDGCEAIAHAVAGIVNEMLVLRGIHCRSRCHIEPRFAAIDAVDLDALPPWTRHQAVYEEFLRRRREAKERILKEQTEEAANARRLLMEREAQLLELDKQEDSQRQARQAQAMESLQAELADEEARLKEQLASEIRRREEELDRQTQLQHMQALLEWKTREAELERQRETLALETARQAEQWASETRLREGQLQHEAQLRQKQAEADAQAKAAEWEKHRADLAAEAARLAEQIDNETRLEEARLRHEAELRQQRAEAELKAMESDLAAQRAELATEAAQQTELQNHELRRREDQLIHEGWLRQMQTEADIKAREIELETQRMAEEARLKKQRESEVRQREEQLRHEAYLRQLQAAAELRAKELELDKLRADMAKVEAQLEQQREYETRQHQEQLRHNAQLRQWQTEQELKEKEIRAPEIAELEAFLNREIGILAMERQRLRLEEEIRETKLARTRDFISKTRRRTPLEAEPNEPNTEG